MKVVALVIVVTVVTVIFYAINANFTCISITFPRDKKKMVAKEVAAVEVKLAVSQIEEFSVCTALLEGRCHR